MNPSSRETFGDVPDVLASIWPLPYPTIESFVSDLDGQWDFGWTSTGFVVSTKAGFMKRAQKTFEAPLTPEGLGKTWAYLASECPALATELRWTIGHDLRDREESARLQKNWRAAFDSKTVLDTLNECTLLGGYGFTRFEPGTRCTLQFATDGLGVYESGSLEPIFKSAYSSARVLEITGPGRVTQGGRFIGGGFGITGAAEGMLAAAVLNSLTTTSEIRTILRWEATDLECWFLYSDAEPSQLRIRLSAIVGKIGGAQASSGPEDDLLARLERLARLRESGVIDDAELARLKSEIMGEP